MLLQEARENTEAAQSYQWELGQLTAQNYKLQSHKRTSAHFEGVDVGSKNEFRVFHIDTIVDYQLESVPKETDDSSPPLLIWLPPKCIQLGFLRLTCDLLQYRSPPGMILGEQA